MQNIYADQTCLREHPTWHAEDSPWKAQQIWRMLACHPLEISTVGEIGCGAGEILVELQRSMGPNRRIQRL